MNDDTPHESSDGSPPVTRAGTVRADGGESAGPIVGSPLGQETTVIARTIVRLVVPLILVTSIALLLQGHNRPGGGFIGGTLTATALALVYVVFGLEFLQTTLFGLSDGETAELHRPIGVYRTMFGGGLAVAVLSGLVPIAVGFPFLTQGVLFLEHLPIYGELEVASALAFDLGVYLTVVGAVATVVAEVGTE